MASHEWLLVAHSSISGESGERLGSFSIDEGDSGENVTFKGEQMDKWIARETQRWADVRMID